MVLTTDASHTSWGVTSIDERRVVDGRKETTHQFAGTANGSVSASEFSLLDMRRESNQGVLRHLNCGCPFHVPGVEYVCVDSSEKSGSDNADVKGYFSVEEWNEILCVKTAKNISTRKELNTNHGTNELVEW
ncbi:hypothetical protein P5673_026488 [Acropora cervicornis]|uniref:Uncharacterized protein n=1 Tax=Acropora cervicornis TaxID=6130 RepID=A0AAD9UWD3_ACRCE|nr:hypothetical protein P5673_026488 [Acropora cervicornis]